MLALLLLAAALNAQPIPGGADLAALAKAPPKREKPAAPAKKAETPAPPVYGSGYDYFHLMASPDMASQPVVTRTKKRPSKPELRDAVATPRPTAASERSGGPAPAK